MDVSKLPPGVEPAPAGSEDRIAVGRQLGENKIAFDDPIMSGIQVQVQHPASDGREEEARDWHSMWSELCGRALLLSSQEGQG